VDLYLQTGRIKADVAPPSEGKIDFKVRSPSATASVRGTSFEFDGLRLVVDDGRVHVSGGDGMGVYVGAGHAVVSNPETGKTTTAAETTREELIPPMPAGMGNTPDVPAAPSATPDFSVGTSWNKE
jgi:ferric-dicitrate binding protein FerR (iron transport regulator)